ncbi:hypothetical protein GALMADRAFT_1127824 [Galerina marginata CBS 339.88]|uniref:Uncharacterized protein n=1 Tax=Galerina marginata (strain CBS 339.88) TaxID=685588 RepID=A0A067SKK4_GALM3|nr:hypothetical protein GALMADRAFT_1127824 [Galerina marginata CBS 339.88]
MDMLINPGIVLPNECCTKFPTPETRDCRVTVQTFATYLARVRGSLPAGFRITVKGKEGEEDISYYYDANSDNQ